MKTVAATSQPKVAQERAARTNAVYSVVLDWTEQGEWLIGSGCIALTKRFAKHGVSVHVLPGLESPDDSKTPLVMVVGANEAGVRKTIDAIKADDAKAYYSSIIKLPI